MTEHKIPEMNIENGQIVEETMSLELVVNGKTEQIVLRKLPSGVRGQIRKSCTKTKYLAGQQSIDVNEAELEKQLIHAAIVSAPFDHSVEGIDKLPGEVMDYIAQEWMEFSNMTPAKKD